MYQQNNPYANNYGYAFGVARPQARNTQPLTPEQIAKLRQNSNAFDMKVEVEDLWRAACTHKEKNGQSTLISNEDGSFTCTICHETFNMCESDLDGIQDAVKTLIDMLQTSKSIYLDAPEELISQYYQIIPLLKKFPSLWDRAVKNFAMYENTGFTSINPMGPGYAGGFNTIQALMTNPYAAFGYQNAPQQPMQNAYGYQQPNAFYGQPPVAGAPGYAPVDGSINPMAYGIPNPTAPVAPAPGVMPGAVAPTPVSDPAATAQPEVKQQQVFNV